MKKNMFKNFLLVGIIITNILAIQAISRYDKGLEDLPHNSTGISISRLDDLSHRSY